MKRRDFSLLATTAAVTATTAGWSNQALAEANKFVEGDDYIALETKVAVEAAAPKVEVVEFFWYNCPHCNAFEPTLAAWLKKLPAGIAFRRSPVAFQDSFVPQQRLYFALDAMGLVDKLHAKVFNAIHNEHIDLSKSANILDWVGKQGVDGAKFAEQFNSFGVATKVTKATQLQNAYKIDGVPSFGVAGRYYVDGTIAKGMPRALQVVESLVASARSGK